MAIPFLNNITLNNNEIQKVRLQNGGNPPLNSGPGQIYFDTTAGDETAKYYSNITDTFVSLKEYTFPAGSFIIGAVTGTTPKPIITFDLSASGTPDATKYLRGDNAWEPITAIPGTYTWTVSDGTNSTAVASGETVTFSGTANEIEVAESGRTVAIGLPNDVTIANNLTVGGTGNFTGQVTIPILPAAQTDAASKDYVDNAVVGGLVYQGGYNATLNTPDLDSGTSIAVSKGWTYTVTVQGLFFTELVRVGDVLISEVDQAAGASALANWTTVQNNIDLASLTQVGIGNVNAPLVTDLDTLGISVAYAAGTATVGLDITGLAVDLFVEEPADYFLPIYDEGSGINNKANLSDLLAFGNQTTSTTGTITAGSLSGTVNHDFGINTIVQTINSSGDTVYCDVTRTATTSVATIAAAEATDITILVQKIG